MPIPPPSAEILGLLRSAKAQWQYPRRENDARIGGLVTALEDLDGAGMERPFDIVIVGVPDDRGILNSFGRPGAAGGPAALRAAFGKLTPGMYNEMAGIRILDAGDVDPGDSVAACHDRTAAVLAWASGCGRTTVCVGGGHDIAYGSIRGKARLGDAGSSIGLVNIDAHLDVRPVEADGTITSGTPFRRLLDNAEVPIAAALMVGINSRVNAAAHYEWALSRGVQVYAIDHLRHDGVYYVMANWLAAVHAKQICVSLDLDAIRQSELPGVSAPAPFGLSLDEAATLLHVAGRDPRCTHLDIMELNPAVDAAGISARAAASLLYEFCLTRVTPAAAAQP